MSRSEDRRRYRAAGLAHEYFELDGPQFAELVQPMLDAIAADPSLTVRMRTDTLTEDGVQTLWHYLGGRRQADRSVVELAGDGEDDCGFNVVWPVPPGPPPNGG
jgi:hypothetical protein